MASGGWPPEETGGKARRLDLSFRGRDTLMVCVRGRARVRPFAQADKMAFGSPHRARGGRSIPLGCGPAATVAALDANGEGSAPVMWGATEEEARQRAVEACKKVSKTCADGPASTHDLNEVFAIVCCTEPRRGCAVSAAANRRDAVKNVQAMFADAGYKDCSVQHYMSAATGNRQ